MAEPGEDVPALLDKAAENPQPVIVLDREETLGKGRVLSWDREDALAEPGIRLSPDATEKLLPLPGKGKAAAEPVIDEERFNPYGYAPLLEGARPGAMATAMPYALPSETSAIGPIGSDVALGVMAVREKPTLARLAREESPGVYVPLEFLEAESAAGAGKPIVWLVEEERYDLTPGRSTATDIRPGMAENQAGDTPVRIFPEKAAEPENYLAPRRLDVLDQQQQTRLARNIVEPEERVIPGLINLEEPEPLPEPEPEPELEPEPKPVSPEPAAVLPNIRGVRRMPFMSSGFAVVYPEGSRRRGESGTVVASADVDRLGRAGNLAIAQSSGFPSLDRAALEAVERARFVPGPEDEGPDKVREQFAIVFRLYQHTP